MRIKLLLLMTALCLWTSCVHHYHEKQGDQLALYLKNPEAKTVYFLYSHDGFIPHQANRVRSGLFRVSVPFVDEFVYFYMIDGEVYLPPCRLRVKDDFGSENCVFSERL